MAPKSLLKYLNAKGDNLGILISGACLVHCLALPALAVFAPVLGSVAENELLHLALLVALLPIATITFAAGKKIHGNTTPLVLGSLGLIFLVAAILAEHAHVAGHESEVVLSVIGSLLLCTGHYLNFKAKKACAPCG